MSARLFDGDVIFLQRFLKCEGLYMASIDGIWGPKTDAAVNKFDQLSDDLANTCGRFDTRSEANILTLHTKAQKTARAFMKAVMDAGVTVRIISGTRTYAEQNNLYKIGRFGNPGRPVTNARGGQSNHNFGIAWDIGVFQNGSYLPESPLYDKAARIALHNGIDSLEWGGNWSSFPDHPHFQLATGMKISVVRSHFEIGQPYV